MSNEYTLYVSMVSPYAMKAATLLGYAGLPVELAVQNMVSRFGVLRRMTGATMVPVLRRDDWAINDSTAIARWALDHSQRPLVPEPAGRAALAWVLEDFADEWGIYVMAYSRWMNEADGAAMEKIIGRELAAGVPLVSRAAGKAATSAIRSQLGKGAVREVNRGAIMASRDRILSATEALFEPSSPSFLFGDLPSVADFSLFGPLGQYARDPSGRAVIVGFPGTQAWLERIWAFLPPSEHADQAVVDEAGAPRSLEALRPLFAEFLGTYWRVLVENHRVETGAAQSKRKSKGSKGMHEVTLLDGTSFHFRASSYLVRRLEALLALLDTAYGERRELFGPEGLGLEEPLIQAVARLTAYPAGVELLREFPKIGQEATR